MDNAKKVSRISQASVLAMGIPWLPGAEKSECGTGLTGAVAVAIRGGRRKRNDTAIGKIAFPLIGKRLSTLPKTVNGTSQT
jgi:hypothetical protein